MEELNLCTDAFTVYYSTHKVIEKMSTRDPQTAIEMYLALMNFAFYGEEYKGENLIVEMFMDQQYPLIEKQNERYNKAIKGGQSKKEQIPWEEIVAAAQTGQYSSLASLGQKFGTSGQNIGRRMQSHGTTLKQLIDAGKAQSKLSETNFETNDQNSSNVRNFPPIETNFNNNNNREFVSMDQSKLDILL